MAWNPGLGLSIRLGKDEILRLGKQTLLLPSLITSLKKWGIHFLYQERGSGRTGEVLTHWKTTVEMGLIGAEVVEWDHYCRAPSNSSIHLTDHPD